MKTLLQLIFITLLSVHSIAQSTDDRQVNTRNCQQINERELEIKMNQIRALRSETERAQALMQLTRTRCLYTSQLICSVNGLLTNDLAKLDVTKIAYPNIVDRENFLDVCDVFSRFSNAIKLYHFINENTSYNDYYNNNQNNPNFNNQDNNYTPPVHSPYPPVVNTTCSVSNDDMNAIVQAINKESFASTKVKICKEIVSNKRCFKASQVKEIIRLFSFESDRLEIAKYAYDFTADKENYFVVHDALEFSDSKEALTDYIKSKR